jgi:hypothetical protein
MYLSDKEEDATAKSMTTVLKRERKSTNLSPTERRLRFYDKRRRRLCTCVLTREIQSEKCKSKKSRVKAEAWNTETLSEAEVTSTIASDRRPLMRQKSAQLCLQHETR